MSSTNVVTPYEGMIQTWRLKNGQTLENTKVEDREKALLCPNKCWQQITNKLNKKQLLEEAKEHDLAWINYLKNSSLEMKKEWPNSIENIRRRRFENLIKQRVLKREQNSKWLVDVLKENEEARQELIKKLKRKIFYENDAVKAVKSAIMLSETLYERDKQIEFEKTLRNKTKVEVDDVRQKIIENSNRLKEENLKQLIKKQNKKKEYKNELLKQISSDTERKKLEAEKQLEREKINLQNMARELKEITEQERQKRLQKQQQLRKVILDSNKNQEEFFKRKENEMIEEDRKNEMIRQSNEHKSDMLKKTKIETRKKAILIKEKLAKDIFSKIKDTTEEEEERMKTVRQEREEQFKKRLLAEKERKQKLINERNEYWQNYLKEKNERKAREKQKRNWEIEKRLRNVEIYKKFLENQAKHRQEQIKIYKEDLLALLNEKQQEQERDEQQELISLQVYYNDLATRDKEFLEYAENILKDRKAKGRWIAPVEQVIMEYKKKNGYVDEDQNQGKKCQQKPVIFQREQHKIRPNDPKFGKCRRYEKHIFKEESY